MNQIQINPNFHKRVETCIKRIGKFLTFYKTPAQYFDIDTGELKEPEVKAWIKLIAETTNGQIDGSLIDEPFDERVREIIAAVAKSYKGRDWPMPHHFETAAHIIAKRHRSTDEQTELTASSEMFGSFGAKKDLGHWAEQMKLSRSVPDHYLYPPFADKLIKYHGVPEQTIDAYQKGFYMMHIKTYGPIEGKAKYEQFLAKRGLLMPTEDEENIKRESSSNVIAAALSGFTPTRAF